MTPRAPGEATGAGDGPSWPWVLTSYLAVFVLLAIRLLLVFPEAVPVQLNLSDAHVITWVLAWVAHSLAVDPSQVFDANISYPARGQLVGMDHLFGAQVLYAPIYALTGNPVLSANLVAFLSYPLAALGMERLLRGLRVPPVIRWVTGFAFALGLSRVPFNLNLIQLSNLYLPWTALALTRLRARPTAPRAVALFLVFALAIFASFYEAVLVGLTCAVWGAFELARGGEGRGRFAVQALVSAGTAGLLLLFAITPYFTHVGGHASALADFKLPMPNEGWAANAWLVLGLGAFSVGKTPRTPIEIAALLVFALIALAAWAAGSRTARRIVPVAAALWLLGAILSYGYPGGLAPLIQASPLKMIRYLHRYAVIGEFGLLLLLAVGLTALQEWAGERAAAIVAVAMVAIVLVGRGMPFADSPMHVVGLAKNAAVYDAVAEVVKDEGGGPLFELPIFGSLPGQTGRATTLEPDAMLASTRHWWQTPAAHTSYHTPQRWFFMNTVAALPAWWALEDLIDLTHVRWLLLRPAEYWRPPDARETTEKFLRGAPDVEVMWKSPDGWLLFRLDRMPRHRAWFEAAQKAERGNATLLGTPLEPLPEASAIGAVRPDPAKPPEIQSGKVVLRLLVENEGDRTWPATPPPTGALTLDGRFRVPRSLKHTVALVARWWTVPSDPAAERTIVSESSQTLRRDVDPGEEIRQLFGAAVPKEDGLYDLEVHVVQVDGARFTAPGNAPHRGRVRIEGGRATLEPPPSESVTEPPDRDA